MRNLIIAVSLMTVLFLGSCTFKAKPILRGGYQSDKQKNGYAVVLSFQQDKSSFVEYIDNREVDRGTYEITKNNVYKIKSDKQNFNIKLSDDNSFKLIIKKINNGKPIQMKNVSDIPTGFLTKFDDIDEYKALLE
jgi:hypothetical protein